MGEVSYRTRPGNTRRDPSTLYLSELRADLYLAGWRAAAFLGLGQCHRFHSQREDGTVQLSTVGPVAGLAGGGWRFCFAPDKSLFRRNTGWVGAVVVSQGGSASSRGRGEALREALLSRPVFYSVSVGRLSSRAVGNNLKRV